MRGVVAVRRSGGPAVWWCGGVGVWLCGAVAVRWCVGRHVAAHEVGHAIYGMRNIERFVKKETVRVRVRVRVRRCGA